VFYDLNYAYNFDYRTELNSIELVWSIHGNSKKNEFEYWVWVSFSMSFESEFESSNSFSVSFELKLTTQTQYSNSFFFEYPCMLFSDKNVPHNFKSWNFVICVFNLHTYLICISSVSYWYASNYIRISEMIYWSDTHVSASRSYPQFQAVKFF